MTLPRGLTCCFLLAAQAILTASSPTSARGESLAAFGATPDFHHGLISFDAPRDYIVGAASLAVGDFNADLKPDLVLVSPQDDAVAYYAGHGDGTFEWRNIGNGFESQHDPASVIVGEFTGDSWPDVVIALYGTSGVYLQAGPRDDSVGPTVFSNVRGKPYSLAAADFDGDSKLDLAVGGGDCSVVGIVRGMGDGSFVTARTVAEGAFSVVGDFNNDGNPDLAGDDVWLGNGDGSFQPKIDGSHFPMAVADLDHDLNADLIGVEPGTVSDRVSVWLGNGDGTFGLPSAFTTGPGPWSIAVADFDGDSNLDVAVANSGFTPFPLLPTSGSIAVLLGRGDGTFGEPAQLMDVYKPAHVVTGDFNGDLRPDIAAVNPTLPPPGQGGAISVFLNKGGGNFQTLILPSQTFTCFIAAGDLDDDHRTDLAVATCGLSGQAVAILLGNSDGTFQVSDAFLTIGSAGPLLFADFNGDLHQDFAIRSALAGVVDVRAGQGDGTFAPAAVFNVAGAGSLAAADFNGDAKPDLAIDTAGDSLAGFPRNIKLLTNTTLWPSLMEP